MKAVFFDLWNTIIYCPTRERVGVMLKRLDLEGKADYCEFIDEMNRTAFIDSKMPLKRVIKDMCRRHNGKCDRDAVADAARIWKSRLEGAEYFPEAKEALKSLACDYKLGLISNTDVSGARFVKANRVDRDFDVIAMSCYVGAAKPDPAIYKAAMKELKLKPKDCLMVGDNLGCDADGAKAAGLDSLLIDRLGRHDGLKGYRIIKSLNEIGDIIR